MAIFRFDTGMRVVLANGTVDKIRKEIAVEADSEREAREYLPSVATESCHDAGSRWFDAPPETIEVRFATLLQTDA